MTTAPVVLQYECILCGLEGRYEGESPAQLSPRPSCPHCGLSALIFAPLPRALTARERVLFGNEDEE